MALALVMALGLCSVSWAETTANCTGSCEHEAAIDGTHYDTLQGAFDAVKTGETVTLLKSITLNSPVTCLVNGITLNGDGKTITCATATKDTLNTTGKTAISFGGKNAAGNDVWCTGVTVQNLKMEGMARFALYFHGGTVSHLENVNISGNYWYAINLYGTHGATMVGCNISNSADLGDANEGGASIWSNVSSSSPLILQNSDVGIIGINKYTTANTLAPKIKIEQGIFADGDNKYIDKLVFKKGGFESVMSYPFTIVAGKKQKGPDDYREVIEQVRKDYRNYLNAYWERELEESGKVEINQEVLKTVNNN